MALSLTSAAAIAQKDRDSKTWTSASSPHRTRATSLVPCLNAPRPRHSLSPLSPLRGEGSGVRGSQKLVPSSTCFRIRLATRPRIISNP
jgi:hypothetical protein